MVGNTQAWCEHSGQQTALARTETTVLLLCGQQYYYHIDRSINIMWRKVLLSCGPKYYHHMDSSIIAMQTTM